jgi:hypothetical protein
MLLINQSIAISKYFEERNSILPIKTWKQYASVCCFENQEFSMLFQQYQEFSMLQCHDPKISGASDLSFSMLFRKSTL